jgi:anti-anti-sigma regulatory factor
VSRPRRATRRRCAALGPSGACEPNAVGSGLVVDTRELQRIDFAAAGALLQWVLSVRGRGGHVEFDGVSPLIAVLFHVVGIDEVATVRLRQ